MTLEIGHQESYSRLELLLRSLLGLIYILLPHAVLIMFVSIWSGILGFLAFWIILFTGRHPESWFEFQRGFMEWGLRLNARLLNLADGYPAFFPSGTDDHVQLTVEYPEALSRGILLAKAFLGFIYVLFPHSFALLFRGIGSQILTFLAWFVVLFTGRYPESWHEFNVGTLRWSARVQLYMSNMTDEYPAFSGRA
jgi:hypothetical protein